MGTLLVYGATGYTGRMASQYAAESGTPIILAGRDESKLATLGAELNAPYKVFSLDDFKDVETALSDVSVVLNCAGPFMRTAEILMRAAISQGVHYLDVSAELNSYELAEALSAAAIESDVMLLPGSGGSVAMLGCLTAHAIERVASPQRIRLALQVKGPMSRGSAISASASLADSSFHRANGQLLKIEDASLQPFDFGMGKVDCFPVTLPDLLTIWRATQVPNIDTFVHIAGDSFPSGDLSTLPDGPNAEERLATRYRAVVEITGEEGDVILALLDTVNGYTFTAMASAEAGRRVLAGEYKPGFQTPSLVFGNGFAETIADTTISDIAIAGHLQGN